MLGVAREMVFMEGSLIMSFGDKPYLGTRRTQRSVPLVYQIIPINRNSYNTFWPISFQASCVRFLISPRALKAKPVRLSQ